MLHEDKGMPKIQIISDEASIKKYGGEKMYFALGSDDENCSLWKSVNNK